MKAKDAARILVLDAHRDVMGHYRRLLEAQGYTVKTSTFLETTPSEIERWHSNLIIFDLLVDAKQEQQAWHLIQQLKASTPLCSLPLLICAAAFVTPFFLAYVHEQDISLLFKPLDTHLLNHKIATLLAPS